VVTVLFCDLAGFTARSDRADPEDVWALLRPYHARVRREIERFGGTLDKFIGDGVMAVFGAPSTHEDDPERAVRCGLAMLEAAQELALDVRIGINTGEAVVAADQHRSEGVVGDVVNTASRLEGVAPVGACWSARPPSGRPEGCSTTSRWPRSGSRARPGRCRCGWSPSPASPGSARAGWSASSARSWTPSPSWSPGARVTACPTGRASASGRSGRCSRRRRASSSSTARRPWPPSSPTPSPPRSRSRPTASGWRRGWRRFLEAMAARRPLVLVLVLEDLHWADDALLAFVRHLVEEASGVPLLVVATARPELADRSLGWGRDPRDRTAVVGLDPLSDADTARLIAAVLGRAVDQDEAHATLLVRIGGNPLYAEQVCRMLDDRGLLERDGATVRLTAADTVLPDSIQTLIAARLDTLPPRAGPCCRTPRSWARCSGRGRCSPSAGGTRPPPRPPSGSWPAGRSSARPAGPRSPARASTPSGTPSPGRWPTAGCRGRPGSPSTGRWPPGSSGWPATGSPTMPSCSPTTT
jgi:hypothetical protein